MIKAKPCPFCGGNAKLHKRLNRPFYAVICIDTQCPGHNLYTLYYKEEDALKAWNRRAGDCIEQ